MMRMLGTMVIALVGLVALWVVLNIYAAGLRADRTADKNWCANNMRMIDYAKEQFAQLGGITNGIKVTETDITPFLKGRTMPVCPSSSAARYSIGLTGEGSECSVHGRSDNIHYPKQVPTILRVCKRGDWDQ